jgi:hypothetical protein
MWEKFWTRVKVVPIRWVLLVLGGLAVILWMRFALPTAPWSPQRIAGYVLPEPKVITKIEKVDVPGPERIRVIPKEKIVIKYRDLPTPATMQDNSAQVTAVADIPPSPDGGVAVAVLRPDSAGVGVGSIEYRPAQPKFFQVKRAFSAEGWYFPAGNRIAEAALIVNPLKIGPVEVKAKAGVDMERETSTLRGFVGVGVEVRF